MEFFMIAASTPKRIHKRLSTVAGFQALPPLFSLGFHYSRWESTSAQKILQYNEQFEESGFPLDVLWMDIGHTLENMYFTFNPIWFNDVDLGEMRNQISLSDRRLVVITDPHIKQTERNRVYT
jgi:alpha-glucosidase (family GH31 glycosyl hydrolase)